jgi:pimeloyl-ACP methyl ester carboxylesterase
MTSATGFVSATTTHLSGVELASSTAGEGPPLVYLHHSFGSPGWTPLLSDLATDHAVAALDLPGFGDSSQPQWARSVRDLAVLTGQWLRAVTGGPATVVGCGFGGWVAAELVTMAPELFSQLVLVGAAGLAPRNGEIFDQMMVNHSTYVQTAFRDLAHYEAVYGDSIEDDVLLRWDSCREMVTRVAWKPYMYHRSLEPLLSQPATPTLVVWGEHDRIVPLECGERFAAALPNARLEVVDKAGHAVDLEEPALLADLVRRHAT